MRAMRVGGVALAWLLGASAILVPCTFARLTGYPCPGCGMTRAVVALLHGDVAASLRLHPLALPTLSAQLVLAAFTLVLTAREGHPFGLWRTRSGRVIVYANAVVLAAVLLLWLGRALGTFGGPVPVGQEIAESEGGVLEGSGSGHQALGAGGRL